MHRATNADVHIEITCQYMHRSTNVHMAGMCMG